jgi:hypothetical protein
MWVWLRGLPEPPPGKPSPPVPLGLEQLITKSIHAIGNTRLIDFFTQNGSFMGFNSLFSYVHCILWK